MTTTTNFSLTFKDNGLYNLWKKILSHKTSSDVTCAACDEEGNLFVTDGMRVLAMYGHNLTEFTPGCCYKLVAAASKTIFFEIKEKDNRVLNMKKMLERPEFKELTEPYSVNDWHSLEMGFAIYQYKRWSANDWNGKRHRYPTLDHDYLMDVANSKLFDVYSKATFFDTGLILTTENATSAILGEHGEHATFDTVKYYLMGIMTEHISYREAE